MYWNIILLSTTAIVCASAQTNPCDISKWTCDNGECIPLKNFCNGAKDCNDGSDESMETCGKNECSTYSFRCDYGACVDSTVQCDGIQDCVDKSDEQPERCSRGASGLASTAGSSSGFQMQIQTQQQLLSIKDIFPVQLPSFYNDIAIVIGPGNTSQAGKPNRRKGCTIGSVPNANIKHRRRPGELEPGANVKHGTSIAYKCRAQHLLVGSEANLCVNGEWLNDLPKCTPYCSTIPITGYTIQTKCEFEESEVPCNVTYIDPGTRVTISCRPGYQKPQEDFPEILTCGSNGRWDKRPVACEQVCGTIEAGNFTNYQAPWTAIFHTIIDPTPFCGGSIINARVVLSAASCFWDTIANEPVNKTRFFVNVGRTHYFPTANLWSERFDLDEIYLPPNYNEGSWFNNIDLAIAVLSDFINFTPFVKPVCIDWEYNSREPLRTGLPGRIEGWGTDFAIRGKGLQLGEVSIVTYDECASALDPKYKNAYTGDKFCANRGNDSCILQKGGGFVVGRPVGNENIYHLRGIISHGINFGDVCSEIPYVAITDIQFYSRIISEYENRFRPRL